MEKPQTSAPWGLSSALALAVVVAISPGGPTFAGCTWTWDGDHDPPGWHVHCSFQDDIFIEGTEGPGGSGGGSCTNCVGMTSEQCNAIKSNIIDRAETVFDECNSAYGDIGDAKYNLDQVLQLAEQIKAEGDNFEYYGGLSAVPGALTGGGKWTYLLNSEVGPYLFYTQNHTQATNSAASVNALIQGANSIYNYYNDRVLPFVDDVILYVNTSRDYLTDVEIKIEGVQNDVLEIRNAASSMNCNACQGSGSGSSGGGSGTPGDGGCPCAAYIQAVQSAVVANGVTLSSILASVNLSKDTLAQMLSKLTEIKTVLDNIKNDVYKIRQTTDLMDDFYREDTSLNFAKLIAHTLTLSNVVVNIPKLPPIKLLEDYTNATSFKMDDGTVRNWREWGATVNTPSGGYQIDFGEYANMNWFQRIEFLLGRLSDVFSQTNNASVDFTQDQKRDVDQTEAKFGDLSDEIENYEESINDLLDKFDTLRDYLNPFHDLFGNLSPPSYITIMPEVHASGSTIVESMGPITLALNEGDYTINDLLEVARNITTFLAWVFLLLLNVSLVTFLIRSLFFVVSWFVRVYQSWSETLFSK